MNRYAFKRDQDLRSYEEQELYIRMIEQDKTLDDLKSEQYKHLIIIRDESRNNNILYINVFDDDEIKKLKVIQDEMTDEKFNTMEVRSYNVRCIIKTLTFGAYSESIFQIKVSLKINLLFPNEDFFGVIKYYGEGKEYNHVRHTLKKELLESKFVDSGMYYSGTRQNVLETIQNCDTGKFTYGENIFSYYTDEELEDIRTNHNYINIIDKGTNEFLYIGRFTDEEYIEAEEIVNKNLDIYDTATELDNFKPCLSRKYIKKRYPKNARNVFTTTI